MSLCFLDPCSKVYASLQAKRPLVQCVTNYVSMELMANGLLAIGASPAMVHAEEEVEEFCHLADALLINIGTLSQSWSLAMEKAVHRANTLKKPWVLDPVGCGTTSFRTHFAKQLIQLNPAIIRGNASEIMALSGDSRPHGVDSQHTVKESEAIADAIAQAQKCVVIVTGPVDYITDGHKKVYVENGSPLMTKVTTVGCMHGAIVAACLACESDPFLAAVAATTMVGLAGENVPDGVLPGTFRVALVDNLASLSEEIIREKGKVHTIIS